MLEESFLSKIENPINGSFAFDNIQYQLCETSWNLFKKWENLGGYLKALPDIALAIDESAQVLKNDFTQGKQVILGVNTYPNKLEKKQEEIEKELSRSHSSVIKPFRLAEKMELERLNQEGVEVK